MRSFIRQYIKRGDRKMVAENAGIHPNTVLAWCNERNAPSPQLLCWFFKAVSNYSKVPYIQIWIHYIKYLEGDPNAYQESKRWIQSSEHQDEEANDESESG